MVFYVSNTETDVSIFSILMGGGGGEMEWSESSAYIQQGGNIYI